MKYLILSTLIILISSTSESESSDLETEIAEAETAYLKLDGTSSKLYTYIEELEDVYNLMDSDDIVTINGETYTKSELELYINDLEQEADQLSHQEELDETAEECEAALGNGTTIDQYSEYHDCLEDLYDEMEENDTVYINETQYNKTQVDDEIEATEDKIDYMEKQEKIQEKIDKVEQDTYTAETSCDYYNLADDYQEVLSEMQDQDYGENDTVTIINENMTMSDIEAKISYLNTYAKDLKRLEDIDNYIEKYETLIIKYIDVYSNTYTTSSQLSDEIDYLKQVHKKMIESELVTINNQNYTQESLQDFIDSQKDLYEYLDDDDLVQVEYSSELTYITHDEFEYQMDISEAVDEIQQLTAIDDKNSSQLHELSDAYSELLEIMDEDKTVVIDGDSYTYQQVQSLQQETEEDANDLENKEIQDKEIESLDLCYDELGSYACLSELEELDTHWKNLHQAMDSDDQVEVDGTNYTYGTTEDMIEEIEKMIDELAPGQIYEVDENGDYDLITTPKITQSSILTSEDFDDLVQGSTLYNSESIVIASNSYSDEILIMGQTAAVSKVEVSTSTSFVQVASDGQAGRDYHEGETKFVLVTSFIDGESATGKVWLVQAGEDGKVLVEGLEKPTGVCVDVNHKFMYVTDLGFNTSGAIYQYSIEFTSKSFEIVSNTSYLIYEGTPFDCKVNKYGDLYFTDYYLGTINQVSYNDLVLNYYGTYFVMFEEYGTYPASLDLYDDKSIVFTMNNGTGGVFQYNFEFQNVTQMTSESNETWGIGLYGDIAFYAIDNPEVKALDLGSLLYETYQTSDLISPKGVCVGEEDVYVADYDAGVLYKGSVNQKESLEVFAFVQAGFSIFCVNVESEDYAMWMIVSLVAAYFV